MLQPSLWKLELNFLILCVRTCIKVHLNWEKVNVKTNFFIDLLPLLNVNIKLDFLWTHLEEMSLSHGYKGTLKAYHYRVNVVNTRTPIAAAGGGPRLLGGCCQYTLAEGSLAVHSNDTRCPSRTRSGLGWLICTPRRPESIDKYTSTLRYISWKFVSQTLNSESSRMAPKTIETVWNSFYL